MTKTRSERGTKPEWFVFWSPFRVAIPIQILATKIRVGVYEQEPEVDLFIAFFESYFQMAGYIYDIL